MKVLLYTVGIATAIFIGLVIYGRMDHDNTATYATIHPWEVRLTPNGCFMVSDGIIVTVKDQATLNVYGANKSDFDIRADRKAVQKLKDCQSYFN